MRKIFFFCALLISPALYGSFPIAHLIVAEIWAEERENYDEEEMREILIGSLFPDIRYLGELERRDTHPENVTIEDIENAETPFEKGIFLHAFLDEKRWEFVKTSNFHQKLQHILPRLDKRQIDTFLKLTEDAVLYETRIWILTQNYLAIILPEETEHGASIQSAIKWHMIVSHYLREGPEWLIWNLALIERGFLGRPADLVQNWNTQLKQAVDSPEVLDHVNELISYFRKEFRINSKK